MKRCCQWELAVAPLTYKRNYRRSLGGDKFDFVTLLTTLSEMDRLFVVIPNKSIVHVKLLLRLSYDTYNNVLSLKSDQLLISE